MRSNNRSLRFVIRLGIIGIPFLCLKTPAANADVQKQGSNWIVSGDNYAFGIDGRNGSILSLRQKGQLASIYQSGPDGLWKASFSDASALRAADFGGASQERTFEATSPSKNRLLLTYKSSDFEVRIEVQGQGQSADFKAKVLPRQKTLLDFALPARLRFAPSQVRQLISPLPSDQSVGAAFNSEFFKAQSVENPIGFKRVQEGNAGYRTVYGASLNQRPDGEGAVKLSLTATGREWLGETGTALDGKPIVVNRPPATGQSDLVLLDSANGPYYSASHLGGTGLLWRISSWPQVSDRDGVREVIAATVEHLAASAPAGRNKIGIIALPRAEDQATIPTASWVARLKSAPAIANAKIGVVELSSAREMLKAASSGEYLAVLNPYGESVPVEVSKSGGGIAATLAGIGQYVKSGGNWFETGGYPFYYSLQPQRYLAFKENYPALFADFSHMDSSAGSVSIYRASPRNWAPWEGARRHDAIFRSGKIAFGGEPEGGYWERSFTLYSTPNQTIDLPPVRFSIGRSGPQSLRDYALANGITRPFSDKMSPDVLAKFKGGILLNYDGSATEKLAHLDLVPDRTLIHFSDYLMGGFDKQYPDHLPPNAKFGTLSQFQEFVSQSRKRGHLVMPYTNPTWWTDNPRSPTFKQAGDAPLLKNLDGSPRYEKYGSADGWTTTFWHPAVQAANRRTVQQFSTEVTVDILFQDQVGIRSSLYDTNPASPTVDAYVEGLLSMADEDSRRKPLSTENGWDGVVNAESQLSGLTWGIVPTEYPPTWSRPLRDVYPANTWEIYPVAQYIAHDKLSFIHHDLGQFVTNREVLSWTLGLGYGLSYRLPAADLTRPATREWIKWLDRLQKSVVSRTVGEPVNAFKHNRSGVTVGAHEDGIITATYGQVSSISNLGPQPRTVGGQALPGYGFYAKAPNLIAANLPRKGEDASGEGTSFVLQGNAKRADLWVYAPQTTDVTIPLSAGSKGVISVAHDGKTQKLAAKVATGEIQLRTPIRADNRPTFPPANLKGTAPASWKGTPPAIGVLDFGVSMPQVVTKVTPNQWVGALEASRLGREFKLPVRRITSLEQLMSALGSGVTSWFAIVNPYGEVLPVAKVGEWKNSLQAIDRYVKNGGTWWETGGVPFYTAVYPQGQNWGRETLGKDPLADLGINFGYGSLGAGPESLKVTAEGQQWLPQNIVSRLSNSTGIVNRWLPSGVQDSRGHITLLSGTSGDYIGAYRLNGWGYFWRIGGYNPTAEVAIPVLVSTLERQYTQPVQAGVPDQIKYLWHYTLSSS